MSKVKDKQGNIVPAPESDETLVHVISPLGSICGYFCWPTNNLGYFKWINNNPKAAYWFAWNKNNKINAATTSYKS